MEKNDLIKMLVIEKISKKEIAKRLNVSEVAVRKKIQKLKEENILLGNKPILNYKKANMCFSITGIDVEPEKLIEVLDELKKIKEIVTIYLSSGDHTILIEVISEDINKINELHKRISSLKGVKRVCPCLINEIIKF
ncbi:MAG: Lrp/AsnC ligand binding domain-containing protein [Candidatus Aenigmatarchaeota archaeon]